MTVQEAIAVPTAWKFRARDFVLLSDSGSFDDYARSELIEGEIWVVQAVHTKHSAMHGALNGPLWTWKQQSGSDLVVHSTPTVEVSEQSLPQPDLILAEPDAGPYVPVGKVRLAVEISDTSDRHDLGPKLRLYAAAGIPEYWVADVNARVIHQMWAPAGEAYAERREVAFGEVVEAVTIGGLKVETGGLL